MVTGEQPSTAKISECVDFCISATSLLLRRFNWILVARSLVCETSPVTDMNMYVYSTMFQHGVERLQYHRPISACSSIIVPIGCKLDARLMFMVGFMSCSVDLVVTPHSATS